MKVAETDPDKGIAELIRLAQRELHGDSVLSDDAGFARVQLRLVAPPPKRPSWVGWLAGAAALVSAATLSALYFGSTDPAITFEVAGGAASQDGRVVGGDRTRIRFSDGSEAALERGAEARVDTLNEHGGRVVLRRGRMRVKIAKKPEAAWNVMAGPYAVRVTGTAFDVSWSSQAQTFDLRMQSGAVIVTGPLTGTGIVLRAGQHLFGGVAEGRLTVEGPSDKPTPAAAPLARAEPSPAAAATAPAPALGSPAPRATPEPHPWTRQVAQGHFAAVLDEAERRGMARTLASGSLEELAALADAARYSGRSSIAKRVLVAERQRFPNSGPARDAAFFLGRIGEDSGSGAIEWYERYLSESPRGPYASQAYGRKMMLLYKQRGSAAAKSVASDYLSRYPNGPYAAAARKITEESAPAPKP